MLKNHKLYSVVAGAILIFGSCTKPRSTATGWAYNDPDNGGFEKVPYEEQETGPGLVLVEGGTFTMGRTEEDVTYEWNNQPRRVTVSSFYIDEAEVTNQHYIDYLQWTNTVFGQTYPEVCTKALPDTLVWREKMAYNEPLVEYYFRHPAYRDYPVVGVNWLQASDYCAWRTDRVNEFILVREGLLDHTPNPTDQDYFSTETYLVGKWQGQLKNKLPSRNAQNPERDVRMEDGIFLPKYRLPTEAEWEYAAYGLVGNTIGERIVEKRIYPWNGHGTRNPNEKFIGQMYANFVRGKGDYMGVSGYLNDKAEITAPVFSYWPNDYGLYNMAGNVSEWVMDVYRPTTLDDIDDYRPFRGNIFKTYQKDSTDNSIAVNFDGPKYQKFKHQTAKLSPSGIVEEQQEVEDSTLVSIPGRIMWRDVSPAIPEDNLDERRNYRTNDYVSHSDGDVKSSIYFAEGEGAYSDRSNKIMYEYGKTSMVNDRARVYKGGSWKDRAYFLVPGTRRYLDQRQGLASLGFRCAMTRVGAPTGLGGKKKKK
jgi:formylglycine-generating enzyme